MDFLVTEPCPKCGKEMEYTGQPDLAGQVSFRFFKCPEHGLIKVYTNENDKKEVPFSQGGKS